MKTKTHFDLNKLVCAKIKYINTIKYTDGNEYFQFYCPILYNPDTE